MFRKSIYALAIFALCFSYLPTPRAFAASLRFDPRAQPNAFNDSTFRISDYIVAPETTIRLSDYATANAGQSEYDIPATQQQAVGPYRTTITLRGNADLARLKKIGVTILSSTRANAIVLADRTQLEQLAKQNFLPRQTELTANLKTATRAPLASTATAAQILAATATDSDNDGLNDTEEGWWCTNANLADSDNDRVNDGDEVNALREWIVHTRATRPASGKPFAGWPPNQPKCYDSDYDSVPDAVEVYVFGLNPNRESTARDKFDDGQKLFGLTNCPGSGGGCGYGALPRLADWSAGVIFAEMPSWVKAPYDSPFVAAFPDPDVEVVPSSFVMTAKTTITTDHTISNGEAKTYGTSETKGTSTSLANTTSWNNWQEVSISTPQLRTPIVLEPRLNTSISASGSITDTKNEINRKTTNYGITMGGLAAVPILTAVACVVGAPICGAGAVIGLGIATVVGVSVATANYFTDIQGDIDKYKQDQVVSSAENSCRITQGNQQQLRLATSSGSLCPSSDVKPATSSENMSSQAAISANQDRGLIVGTRYAINNQSQLTSQKYYNSSYPLPQVPVTTVSGGKSWGGAQTETHTEYQEHTVSQSQQFSSAQSWGTATALNTTQAAELRFTYRISNKGTDYAREISGISFNIYIGDDPNPIATYYPASDIALSSGGNSKFTNFMPGETHTYSSNSTGTNPIYLTLDQMRQIDTGAHIYIVVEDFSYGVDELFYQDAINSGASFAVDNGDGILHSYVLPTWGTETIQDVAKRFFPATEDASGNLLSLTVPHYATTTPTWTAHALTDTAWWNLYLNNLGDGSAAFKDTPASANSTVLIRMNSDTDRDGYSDRTELALGTNPNNAASHPTPALTAASRSVRVGNVVTTTMAFLNSGNYDAYGIEAVLYAPDATVTINDNTIGGSGRVKSASQVVLGSRVMPATTTNWRGTSKPYSTGSYSGNSDKVFTFTAANPGNISQATVNINWNDGVGNSGTVNFGTGYNAPLPITIRDGLQIGFDTGTVNAGDVFTVAVRLPRDTFSYTINQEPYTTPVVVVSYNDPQGNHKFVSPVEVADLGTNLAPYASQMLPGVGVDISTNAAFNASANNTIYLVANSPHNKPITNGHLFVEYVNDAGTVVAEQVFTQTLQSGPTVVPVTFNVSSFNPAYQVGHDYTLLAFFTDSQGNIIDSHARLFSTFGADPQPVLNTSPATWNIGTVTQGAQPQQTISIVNTGIMPLNVVVNSSDPKLTLSGASGIITIPPAGTTPVIATLDTTTLSGVVSMSLTIRSNDPAHQTVTVPVNGTVSNSVASAFAFDVTNRPLDKTVRVYGNVAQFSTVDFTHGLQPDTATIEPCKIYTTDATPTLKGVGKYCADFAAGTSSYQMFGDGRDGDLVVTSGMTVYADLVRTNVTATGTTANTGGSTGFAVGDLVLFHQSQGTGNIGRYEFNTIAAINTTTNWTLAKPLTYAYDNTNGRAQAIKVRQYRNVTVESGGSITSTPWDGWTGGIVAFLANGTTTVNGNIIASHIGFAGGLGGTAGANNNGSSGAGPGGGGGGVWAGGNAQGGPQYGTSDLSVLYLGSGGGGGNSFVGGSYLTPNSRGGAGAGYSVAGSNGQSATDGGTGSYPGSRGGNGGSGGGIIIIASKSISLNSILSSNGQDGEWIADTVGYGLGGGGSGGSILLKGQNITLGTNRVTATGGLGGSISSNSQGAGGNATPGRIRVEYCDTFTGSTNPVASTQKLSCYIAEKTDASTVRYTVPDTVTSPGQNYVMQFARRLAFVGAGNQLTYSRVVSQTYASATMDALVTNVGAGGATNLQIQVGNTTVFSQTQTITQPTTINLTNFASAVNQYIVSRPISTSIDVPMRVTIDRQADVLLTNFGVTPGAGVDLVVNPSDLVLGCPGGASCLASEGNTIPITVTVRNTGAQNAASAVVGYYACRGDACVAPTDGRLLGNSYVATIPAGGTTNATFSWNTEGFTRTQTLYAVVDPPNAIAETLENNNVVSQTLYIKTKPDLRVASIALSSTDRVVGEPITATIVISNTGETNAISHYTGFDARGGGFSDTQNLPTSAIAATSTLTLTRPFTPTVFGSYLITITADATTAITESLESNNVMTRTVFVGIGAQNIDAGHASDVTYTVASGVGFLNGATYDFGGATITKTVRYDGSGAIQYRFDGLQATRFYHLDATFYQEGDNFNQLISFDGMDSGKIIALVNAQASTTTILVPPAAYADGTMIVTIARQSGGTAAPTRFRNPRSTVGPAFVSQIALTPIEYTYLDAGGASDVAYDPTRGYGYINPSSFASNLGASDAVSTYRTVFTNTLYYRFNNLNPAKNYQVNVTMYDGIASTRAQTITIDGAIIPGCANLALNAIVRAQCPITPTAYSTDRTITVGIVCGNCTSPRVNEIALEEKTRDVIAPTGPTPTQTPSPTVTTTPTYTLTPTATPTNTVQTTISNFAAQWAGSAIQINWSTTRENKTDTFQIWRTTSLAPAAWSLVKSQTAQSNCANDSTPRAYGFTDTNVVSGQTYHYKLTWSGDACGGIAGAIEFPTIITVTNTPLATPTANWYYLPQIEHNNIGGSGAPIRATPTLTPTPKK